MAPLMQAATSPGPPTTAPAELIILEGKSSFLRTRTEVLREHADWYRERIGVDGPPWGKAALLRSTAISHSGGRRVWRLAPGPGGAPGTVLKVERPPLPGILRRLISRSGAEREFRNLQAMRALGFPAVEPIAHGRQRFGPLRLRTFLVTRDFEGSISLRQWTRAEHRPIPQGEIEGLLHSLAPALAILHRGGGAIRTLLAKNILVRRGTGGLRSWRFAMRRGSSRRRRAGSASAEPCAIWRLSTSGPRPRSKGVSGGSS